MARCAWAKLVERGGQHSAGGRVDVPYAVDFDLHESRRREGERVDGAVPHIDEQFEDAAPGGGLAGRPQLHLEAGGWLAPLRGRLAAPEIAASVRRRTWKKPALPDWALQDHVALSELTTVYSPALMAALGSAAHILSSAPPIACQGP